VKINGRNLRPIVEALKLHSCEFIAEFDPEDSEPPTDKDAPYIASITRQTWTTTARRREKETES
jgi:hypothetical protein